MYTSWVRPGSTYLIGEIDGVRRLIKRTYYPNQNAYTWSVNSDKYVSNIFVVFAGYRGVTSNDIANGRSVLDRLSFECEARIMTPVIPTYTLNTSSVPFDISGNKLITNALLDYETHTSYTINVSTIDSSNNTFNKDVSYLKNIKENLLALYPSIGENLDYLNTNNLKNINFLYRKIDQFC